MSDQPLFQNTDDQERAYAPEQLPNANIPDEEIDRGGTAGSSTAAASREGDAEPGRANIAGAEGDQRTAPVVAVRPDVSANTPVMTPAAVDERRLNEDSSESRS
jgi:hypothetical protein